MYCCHWALWEYIVKSASAGRIYLDLMLSLTSYNRRCYPSTSITRLPLLPSRGSIGIVAFMSLVRLEIISDWDRTHRLARLRDSRSQIVERNGTTHDDFLGFERHSEVLDASTYANQPKQHNIYMDNTYQSDIETTATV